MKSALVVGNPAWDAELKAPFDGVLRAKDLEKERPRKARKQKEGAPK